VRVKRAALCLAISASPLVAHAATIDVLPGESIQAAIAAATPGDVIEVAAGEFLEDLDFLGKAVTVVGAPDWTTVVRGTGTGPVVTFASGEGYGSAVDGLTITGGLANVGGGIAIVGSSPLVLRNKVFDNRAHAAGSGVYLADSRALVLNNVLVFNRNTSVGGDPHNMQIQGGAPLILNNTIVRGDSNGLLMSNTSALVVDNVFAWNRGRGICDFSGGGARIYYNAFHGNDRAALLTDGVDYAKVADAEAAIGLPRLVGNIDGDPGFEPRIRKRAASGDGPFTLAADALARDAGLPVTPFDDPDGTRNDLGATGGPWSILLD